MLDAKCKLLPLNVHGLFNICRGPSTLSPLNTNSCVGQTNNVHSLTNTHSKAAFSRMWHRPSTNPRFPKHTLTGPLNSVLFKTRHFYEKITHPCDSFDTQPQPAPATRLVLQHSKRMSEKKRE